MKDAIKPVGNVFGDREPGQAVFCEGDYFFVDGVKWVIVGVKGNHWIVAKADGSTMRLPKEALFGDG